MVDDVLTLSFQQRFMGGLIQRWRRSAMDYGDLFLDRQVVPTREMGPDGKISDFRLDVCKLTQHCFVLGNATFLILSPAFADSLVCLSIFFD